MAKKQKSLNYIEFGSSRHAALLGLIKTTKEEAEERKIGGFRIFKWKIEDITKYGSGATDRFLEEVLKQKVNELTSPPIPVQSDSVWKPNYAEPLWLPADPVDADGNPVRAEDIKVKGII